ncbi:MAG: Zn-dependent peptidase ImmA, family [Chitinophagaceae bacterium]|nr:Zn-dependent peptidase ImmA, family [Chitinophagaceae bacterium]
METDRYDELAELAESIANENFNNGKTDLGLILKKKKIQIVKGNYEEYFIGTLYHKSKQFTIHLNMDMLRESHNPRIRFTVAHELGHFFIDEHRNLLTNGTSLSFNNFHNKSNIEKEANHFASFLLMPAQRFIKRAQELEKGIRGILQLATEFESSIESTAIQYMKLNCCNGLLIRWNEDNGVKSYLCSSSFARLNGSGQKPLIQVSNSYLDGMKTHFKNHDVIFEILECATNLSKWMAKIAPNSNGDITALEQTIKMGHFGGLTLVSLGTK